MNILVTGGAGYIGSVVTQMLVEHGYKVVILDNLLRGSQANINPKATFIEGNIGDRRLVVDILSKYSIDAVMHFAAFIQVGESIELPQIYFENNYTQSFSLLLAMQEAGVKKLVFSSTAAVYGTPEKVPVKETYNTRPINPYGLSKLMFEETLAWFAFSNGLSYAALRYFNAAGMTENFSIQHKPVTHIIPLLLDVARGEREAFQIYGDDYNTPDGTCIRDYVHVLDIASAHLVALNNILNSGNEKENKNSAGVLQPSRYAYNIGNGMGFSVKEVIAVAEKVVGAKIPVILTERRAGDPAQLVASSDKIRALGWQPEHSSLEEIIGSAWKFAKV